MIKISAISYLNTVPFVHGLMRSGIDALADIALDYPAECARKLIEGQADVGIVPVAVLPLIPNARVVSGYCIGATGRVRTVSLLGQCPVERMERIFLDYQSRTSVQLLRLLCAVRWGVTPQWEQLTPQHDIAAFANTDGVLVIGDRVFDVEQRYAYNYDLAYEWQQQTGLPFVFAAWVANRPLAPEFEQRFEKALGLGIQQIEQAVAERYKHGILSHEQAVYYLRHNISFNLDAPKREAMELFISKLHHNS